MNIIYFLAPIAILLAGTFALFFVMCARRGEFDDLDTPAHRMLIDDETVTTKKG